MIGEGDAVSAFARTVHFDICSESLVKEVEERKDGSGCG